jgi:hypothetical protein
MRIPALGVFAAFAAALCAAQVQPVEGEYIEDRSNHVYGCYCEWSGESVTGGTEAILGWRITRGAFDGVDLAGVRVAAVIRGEATLSQGNAARASVLILDQRASAAQRRAAGRWLIAQFGALLGEVLERRVHEIEFSRTAERATLKVRGLINMEVRKARPAEDSLPGSTHWYDPFIPLTEPVLGTTLHTAYQGQEFNRQWDKSEPGVRGYFGTFRLETRPRSVKEES